MNILAITSPQSGVGYHRIIMPIVHMKKDYAMITDTLAPETFEKKYDIFLMNRFLVGVSLQNIKDWRKQHGFKLVVDNDDYWHLDPQFVLTAWCSSCVMDMIHRLYHHYFSLPQEEVQQLTHQITIKKRGRPKK